MKAIALALGAVLTAGASAAFAQFDDRPYPWNDVRNGTGWGENRYTWRDDPPRARYYLETRDWRGVPHECWNPRARHYELAREGEYQDDLDYGRCRPLRYEYRSEYVPRYRYYR